MKTHLFILAFLFTLNVINAQEDKTATLKITIENVSSGEGTILASLHTEDTFLKTPGVASTEATAEEGTVTLEFENVDPGTYAILVIHDRNDNKQMDFDASGMPTESYGQTGDINLYGPPVFADSKFEMTGEDQEFNIRF
ncbi:uncharacterized protein (DUF2141 family) [Flavobacteriaceae bacterium MAR_2009_75]|nr:uncharacterized protein (DUF2141 family) [Flavobacteriaceae bacterium MAR_2009_75]